MQIWVSYLLSVFPIFSPAYLMLFPVLTLKELRYKLTVTFFHLTIRSLTWSVWNTSAVVKRRSLTGLPPAIAVSCFCWSALPSQRHRCQELSSGLCERQKLFRLRALSVKYTESNPNESCDPFNSIYSIYTVTNIEAKWLKHTHTDRDKITQKNWCNQ